jgi:hypothetical protein
MGFAVDDERHNDDDDLCRTHRSCGVGGGVEQAPVHDVAEFRCETVFARKGLDTGVDQPDDMRVDVGTSNSMTPRGDLDSQRETDLAKSDNAHIHAAEATGGAVTS